LHAKNIGQKLLCAKRSAVVSLELGAIRHGIRAVFLRDIIILKRRGLLDKYKCVAEIGAQQINDRLILSHELDEAVELFGGVKPKLRPIGAPEIGPNSQPGTEIGPNSPPGSLLWSALGMKSKSLDIVGGDVSVDLNKGRVPFWYRNAFDLAINTGTPEHIANQGNAFAAIHQLIRVGGMMYHQLPNAGLIDHGFFSYQPKFFRRLAEINNYEVVHLALRTHGETEIPPYLNNPGKMTVAHIAVAMIKKAKSRFVMPMDT
jgi:hypothetical protein